MNAAQLVKIGDIPPVLNLKKYGHLIPLSERTILNHWKERYPGWIFRDRISSKLMIRVIECDRWLDGRGNKLLSVQFIEQKKKINNGAWKPLSETLDQDSIVQLLTLGVSNE